MCGRQVGGVIDGVGIDAVAARRLKGNERVAEIHGREEVVVIVAPRLFCIDRDDFAADGWQEFFIRLLGGHYAGAAVLWLSPEVLHSAIGTLGEG